MYLDYGHHQAKVEQSRYIEGSMYLDYVLLWPDDGCFTAETCCIDDNYKIFSNC